MTMKIEEAQKIVHEWINSIGVRYFNELTNTAMLMEEVGEVAELWLGDMANNPKRNRIKIKI